MKICILGNGLTALTLAKALTKQNVYVDVLCNIKNLNISKTRTIGISKSNIEFINKNVININKLLWKLNKIEIFSDNLNRKKLIDFEKDNDQIFSTVKNFKFSTRQFFRRRATENIAKKISRMTVKNMVSLEIRFVRHQQKSC